MNRSSLAKSGLWATYGAVATRLLALVSNLFLARLLLPSEFGVIGITYIFWAFGNLFMQDTIASFIAYKGTEDKRLLNTAYTIGLGIGVILALGLIALSPLIAQFFGIPALMGLLMIFAFNLVLSAVQTSYAGVLMRQLQHQELANATVLASLVRVGVTVGCATQGFSYWSFAIGDTAYWLTACVLTKRQVKHSFRLEIAPHARQEVMTYCLGATGSSLGYYLNANFDNFTIAKLLGSTSLGHYNLAYQLTMSLTTMLSQAIGQVATSAFAQLSDEAQRQLLVRLIERIAFLSAPVYALFYLLLNPWVITVVFGKVWLPMLPVIPWLLVFAYFRLLNSPLLCMLAAKGKPGINAKVNLCIAPLAVLSFVIGAKTKGIVGVSIAVALVLGIIWTVYWWWTGCRQFGWSLPQFLIPCFQPALFAIGAVVLAQQTPVPIQPVVLISIYLGVVRLIVPHQLALYSLLLNRLSQKIVALWHRKS